MGDDGDESVPVRDNTPHVSKYVADVTNNLHLTATDRSTLLKLPRNDLEDRLLILNEENLLLKRSLNLQGKDLRRLQTQVQRLESTNKDKKATSPSRQYEDRIKNLEQTKRGLEGKVEVLKQQLHSHSRLHAQAHRTMSGHSGASTISRASRRPCPFPCTPSPYLATEFGSRPLNYDEERDVIRSVRDHNERNYNASRNGLQQLPDLDPLEDIRENAEADGNLNKVVENIELIRLKRLLKRQAAQLAAVTAHSESTENEIQKLKDDYKTVVTENESLNKLLNFERQKVQNMMKELSVASSLKQDIRVLEEQVRDLMQERVQLKDHNEQLLNLAASNSEDIQMKKVTQGTADSAGGSSDVPENAVDDTTGTTSPENVDPTL